MNGKENLILDVSTLADEPEISNLMRDPISEATALAGAKFLSEIFILGEKPIGGVMVARALENIQDASVASNAVRILMSEILGPLGV